MLQRILIRCRRLCWLFDSEFGRAASHGSVYCVSSNAWRLSTEPKIFLNFFIYFLLAHSKLTSIIRIPRVLTCRIWGPCISRPSSDFTVFSLRGLSTKRSSFDARRHLSGSSRRWQIGVPRTSGPLLRGSARNFTDFELSLLRNLENLCHYIPV